jgi:thiamine pyrophosphate-dependent acetolactate synthase large subunit-like protein
MDSKTARIRALNDELRQNFAEGIAVMTPGIAALGAEAVARIVRTVAVCPQHIPSSALIAANSFSTARADGAPSLSFRRIVPASSWPH